MFENRLFFVDKLVAMGARITLCDPHRAIVSGPSRLHGERVESPDIRAGMAMLIAALAAEGISEIGNVVQIDRGYERIDLRLRELGARIERVAIEPVLPSIGLRAPPNGASIMTRPIEYPQARETSCPTRCGSCARSRRALAELSSGSGYGEVATPDDRVPRGARSRRRARRPGRLSLLRRGAARSWRCAPT